MVPDKGGGRAYALLVQAMEEAGRVAIGRIVLRTKSSLCALRAVDGRLLLSTMYYADELVGAGELELPAVEREPSEREVGMALQLVESMTAPWQPAAWKDEYREKVLELVEKKVEGEEVVAPAEEAPARVIDLMEALRRSLGEPGEKEPPAAREKASERKPARARRAPSSTKKTATRRKGR